MPTTRPRHAITETESVSRALAAARRHWPDEPSTKLLTRLIEVGATTVEHEDDADRVEHERAVAALTGLSEHYPDDYLDDVRSGWGRVIVVDANVVIAVSTPHHVHHDDAVRIVSEHGRDGLALHSLTLAEVLVGPARNGAQVQARVLLENAGFRLSPTGDPAPEHLALVRATTSLKMPDACVLATAEHLGAELATFDARLARAAAARGTRTHGAPDA